jgi:hypothetical protein
MSPILPLESMESFRLPNRPRRMSSSKMNYWTKWLESCITSSETQPTLLLAMPNGVPQVCDVCLWCSSLICSHAVRALISTISSNDHAQIKALHEEFSDLKAAFDRAVNVAALTLARKSGEYQSCFCTIYSANSSDLLR